MCKYTRTYIYFAIFVRKDLNLSVFYFKNIYFLPFRHHNLKLCDSISRYFIFYELVECMLQKNMPIVPYNSKNKKNKMSNLPSP